jgi:antitoxin (DNA-binding transcriptional repressor) of toxin-antitoxin stability system
MVNMKRIDIKDSDINLEFLLSLVRAGYEVILMDGETPLARLSPVDAHKRTPNLHPGGWISEDFDAPLPDEFWLGDE